MERAGQGLHLVNHSGTPTSWTSGASLKNGKVLLALGILVRILTFWFLRPTNNDDHFDVIQFLVANRRLPIITDQEQAYHPPLYYLLAAPFLKVFGTEKAVQFLSLSFSIASLAILYVLVYKAGLIKGLWAQLYSFIFACFLPHFVMFTLYVSNDTLAIFLGALVVLQSRRFIQSIAWKEGFLLAIVTVLSLLTKATFLAFLPVLLALVVFMNLHTTRSLAKASWAASAFMAVAVSLGSYKFVDNYVRFRDPFMNPLDRSAEWIVEQKTHYLGLSSYLDINIFHLLRSPALSGEPLSGETASAYPVLVYATFWYQHIPESNFVGNLHSPFKY